jgi:hypothetical protein
MMIELMTRSAHAISGIGEKPALLTEGGLLLALNRPLRKSVAGREADGDRSWVNLNSREQHDEAAAHAKTRPDRGQATFKFVADSLPLFRSASTS